MSPAKSTAPLLAYFTAFFYILFSLIPDSHSMMVAWSWVFVWQIGLFCPLLWFVVQLWDNRCLYLLGNGFDQFILLVLLVIGLSTIGAEFPQQARWYAWASLGFLATLYPVSQWLNKPLGRYHIFLGQGYLSLAFVVFSLGLWLSQTFLPEISRLQDLGAAGAELEFNFSVLALRNWAPVGHQNYVAGYLILCLPMLLGLTILHRDWRRWLWLTGVVVGGIDLYTTSSRGGWFGLAIACITAFLFAWQFSQIRKFWLTLVGILTAGILIIFVLTNNRLYQLIMPIAQGDGLGELTYRWVNAQVGWQMGAAHPWTGAGLGNVPLLYQAYRPFEAGRLSEIIYQLHSTPVQLWAEMGIGGISLFVGSLFFLWWVLWRLRGEIVAMSRQDRILLGSIYTGLMGYWALSLTDYQLDNVCISGILVILVAVLAAIARNGSPQVSIPAEPVVHKFFGKTQIMAMGLLGFYGAIALWLLPIHVAWEKSSDAFTALNQAEPDYDRFVTKLKEAQKLAPWEPYYPYELGWNLGELALKTPDLSRREAYLAEAIDWFEQGNKVSPYREFGRSNLAWLNLANTEPDKATAEFVQSVRLLSAKRGVFYGLGLSLLEQNQVELAVQAIALEILRDPTFITSPIWRSEGLAQLYPAVATQVMQAYQMLLEEYPEDALLHRCRGAIAWWLGDNDLAKTDLVQYGTEMALSLLETENTPESQGAIALLREAWDNPDNRVALIDQAWASDPNRPPLEPTVRQDFSLSMTKAPNFEIWLRAFAPTWQYRRLRSGFNVISRHIDGVNPSDFWTVSENVAIVTWFGDVFPSITYDPNFDTQLQPLRQQLIDTLSNASE
ncbi:MAG: O-antigen ligase family protein [Limnothrix sp.]